MDEFAYADPDAALAALLAAIEPVATERVPLRSALGRVLAEALRADRPSPPCDVSAMDGFALRVADLGRGALPIAGAVRIGGPPPSLPPGAALRIVTGAALPAGADAVIRHEDSVIDAGLLRATTVPKLGDHIRRAGENVGAGAIVIPDRTPIVAPVAGSLASFGAERPLVRRVVRVATVTTGDELDEVGATPPPWRIRDGNAIALEAMLGGRRWLEVIAPRRAPDEPQRLAAILRSALEDSDALLVTGGVSMGECDFVPEVLRSLGVAVLFHRLPQRPGKPLWTGVAPSGRPVLALPGNPVSVLVTARRFALPALARRAGFDLPHPPAVRLKEPDERRIPLWWHRPVRISAPGIAQLLDTRGSGDVAGIGAADGFVEMPPRSGGEGPWPYFAWRE